MVIILVTMVTITAVISSRVKIYMLCTGREVPEGLSTARPYSKPRAHFFFFSHTNRPSQVNNIFSGAPAAPRAAKRSPSSIEKETTRMHRNRNPCNSFLMVNMASGMDHGRVRPTTTTANDDGDDDVAQHGGHPANTKSCSLGLQHLLNPL